MTSLIVRRWLYASQDRHSSRSYSSANRTLERSNDAPIDIDGWKPQNDSGHFSGKVTMRDVARFSINVPTVKIAQETGN